MFELMTDKRLTEIETIAQRRDYQHEVVLGDCTEHCGACAIGELLAEVKQLRAAQDGDVRAVAEACAGVVDGTPPQPIRHEYAVRRLRTRFADRIAVLEACDAKASVKRTPEQWCEQYGVDIADPDGWRSKDAPAWDEPITLAEFLQRARQSTARNVPDADWQRIAHDAKAGEQQ